MQEAEAKKKEAEEEAARKKEEEASKTASGIFEKVSDALSAVVDKAPFLAPAQPYAQAAIDFVEERPYVLYAAAALPALALLISVFGTLFGGKKVRACFVSLLC